MSCSFAGTDTVKYTADGVKVYNLYIGHIPAPITESDIRDYFSKFGGIKSVRICTKKGLNNHVHRFGFVNFEDAKSAGAALQFSYHRICKTVLRAKYADSWQQPDSGVEKNDGSDPTDSGEIDPITSPIMRLNDDCLLHVFSFLNLRGQINTAKACERFEGIFETLLRIKKCLKIDDDQVTLMQLKEILDIAGEVLHEIKVGRDSLEHPARSVQLISKVCPNLRVLQFANVFIHNPVTFKEIGLKLQCLKKIEFSRCKIRDDNCQYLALLQNLEYIDLSNNYKITGKYLDNFPKLTYLNLKGCSQVESRYFSSICEKGTFLKCLNIIDCEKLSTNCYSRELSKLKLLEELSVGYSENLTEIKEFCQLKSLKALTIIRPSESAFRTIVENHSEKLESLTLMGDCLQNQKVELIYQLKNLKKLCFVKFKNIYDSFIEKLCDLKKLNHLGFVYSNNVTEEALIKLFDKPSEIKALDITETDVLGNEGIIEIAKKIKARGDKSPLIIYSDCINDTEEEMFMEYAPFVKLSSKQFFLESDIERLVDSDSDGYYYSDSSD